MENWCRLCLQEGKEVVAKFTVNGKPACAAHYMAWRKEHPDYETPRVLGEDLRDPAPLDLAKPPLIEEESSVPKEKPNDAAMMQADRDAGMKVPAIAKKYGCSIGMVYSKTRGGKHKAVVASPNGTRTKTKESFSSNLTISEYLTKLRARRDALNEAIEALEMANRVLAQIEE